MSLALARAVDSQLSGRLGNSPWLRVALLLLSTAVLIGSVVQLLAAYRQLAIARAATGECRELSQSILQMADRPTVAALVAESPQELIRRITRSIGQAGISGESLVSVTPAEVMRIVSTDYQQRLTEIELSGISLPLLASFYNALDSGGGLYLSDLLLVPSDAPVAGVVELWDVRLTLTQIIYSPTSP